MHTRLWKVRRRGPNSSVNLPALNGEIRFENATFLYRAGMPEIVRNLSLSIRPGQVVGIIGRSGSETPNRARRRG